MSGFCVKSRVGALTICISAELYAIETDAARVVGRLAISILKLLSPIRKIKCQVISLLCGSDVAIDRNYYLGRFYHLTNKIIY